MLQTVLFPKSKFTMYEAIQWLINHGHTHHKIDITKKFYRFRQHDPLPHGQYYTVSLPNGVELVHSRSQ